MISITVIVPIFNVKDYLEKCLKSIEQNLLQLKTHGHSGEVILVDDGSTDGSSEIAEQFALGKENYQYVKQENLGPGAARNIGISLAQGAYLLFVDADDYLLEDTLWKLLQTAEDTQADLTVCNVVRVKGNKYSTSSLHFRAFWNLSDRVSTIRKHHNYIYDALMPNKLIKKSFADAYDIRYPENTYYEDTGIVFPTQYKAKSIAFVQHVGYAWRIRTGNNRSITQRVNEVSVVNDKLNMMGQILDYAASEVKEPDLRKALFERFANRDFLTHVDALQHMDADTANTIFALLSSFAHAYYQDADALNLSPYSKQLLHDIMTNDMDHAIRVNNYRRIGYANAPISENDQGTFIIHLPGTLFDNRTADYGSELTSVPPSCFIDKANLGENSLNLQGHVYRKRVNCPIGGQSVSATLVNSRTWKTMPLPINAISAPFVTVAHGDVLCYDDFREYHYVYDGSGFELHIDFESLRPTMDMIGDNHIVIQFDNRLENGNRLLTGMNEITKKALQGKTYRNPGFAYSLRVDCSNNLIIAIEAIEETESAPKVEPVVEAEKKVSLQAESDNPPAKQSFLGKLKKGFTRL